MKAAVVLGEASARPICERRVEEAAILMRNGTANLLVLVGTEPEARRMIRAARLEGMRDSRMLWDGSSKDTMDNALNARELLRGRDLSEIHLVTSGFHLLRAQMIFRCAFPEIPVYPHNTLDKDIPAAHRYILEPPLFLYYMTQALPLKWGELNHEKARRSQEAFTYPKAVLYERPAHGKELGETLEELEEMIASEATGAQPSVSAQNRKA